MKNTVITLIFFLNSLWLIGQQDHLIAIGKKEIISSKVLNENRTLWIYNPSITSQNAQPDKKYPVLYVLDGEAHFYATCGIIQQLSQANGNGTLPEMIVVGIENTDRFRDLVPSNDINKPNPFVEFLSKELIPHMDRNYQTAPYRLLVGHSLGGLTTMAVLTHSPDLFNAYIAIDPSMSYNNEKHLLSTITNLPKQKLNEKRLFIGIANTLPKGTKLAQLKQVKSAETQHIRSIFILDKYLKSNIKGLQYSSKYYDKENHNSVPLLSIYDGLRFVFDYYRLEANDKDVADTTGLLAKKLREHYNMVSEKMGYQNAAPESLINYLAYEAMNKKYYSKAKALFELNIDWYPSSPIVYDSYADYFITQKDTANAIEFYQKSLRIKENVATQRKLDALTGHKDNKSETVDLRKYAGVYVLERYNIPIVIEVRDSKLFAKVPGQIDDEFELISKDTFTVKGKQGYTITFEMINNKPTQFISVQPNGTFRAIYKNE